MITVSLAVVSGMTVEVKPHIAVIVCDTPIPGIAENYGDFGDNVVKLIADANRETPVIELPLKTYQVSFEENGLDYSQLLICVYSELSEGISNGAVKGVILTGSRSDSFAEGIPWITALDEFLQQVLFKIPNLPIVGLCFGHQILGKNLGAPVGRNVESVGWEVGITTISLKSEIFELPDSPFAKALGSETVALEKLNLVEFHRDVVHNLPPPKEDLTFLNIGNTAKCAIQGLITEKGDIKVLTFQGHPEFTTPQALDMLKRDIDLNIIDKHTYEKANYNTEVLNNLGVFIGKVISYFLKNYID